MLQKKHKKDLLFRLWRIQLLRDFRNNHFAHFIDWPENEAAIHYFLFKVRIFLISLNCCEIFNDPYSWATFNNFNDLIDSFLNDKLIDV